MIFVRYFSASRVIFSNFARIKGCFLIKGKLLTGWIGCFWVSAGFFLAANFEK